MPLRTPRLIAAVLAVVLPCAATSVLVAAAHAGTGRYTDPAEQGGAHDVREVVVRHSEQRLVVDVALDRLDRDAAGAVTLFVDHDAGRRGPEVVVRGDLAGPADRALLHLAEGWRVGEPLDCAARVRPVPGEDLVRLRVDRLCLDDAPRLRVGVKVQGRTQDPTPDREVDWLLGDRRLTPWLAAGRA